MVVRRRQTQQGSSSTTAAGVATPRRGQRPPSSPTSPRWPSGAQGAPSYYIPFGRDETVPGDAPRRPHQGSVPRAPVEPVHGGCRSGVGVGGRRAARVGTARVPPNRPRPSVAAAGYAAPV